MQWNVICLMYDWNDSYNITEREKALYNGHDYIDSLASCIYQRLLLLLLLLWCFFIKDNFMFNAFLLLFH